MSIYIHIYIYISIWGFPKIRRTFFGGPNIKDYNILGSILRSPYCGKLPYIHIYIYISSLSREYMYILPAGQGRVAWGRALCNYRPKGLAHRPR